VLEKLFEGQIVIKLARDPGTTGNFELTDDKTGTLLHSKKKKNQGFIEGEDKVSKIMVSFSYSHSSHDESARSSWSLIYMYEFN
jgi:hypothetical protein